MNVPSGFSLGMDKYQKGWYEKDAGTKYPGICYDASPRDSRVSYVLVWKTVTTSTTTVAGGINTTEHTNGTTTTPSMAEHTNPKLTAYIAVWHLAAPTPSDVAQGHAHSLDPKEAIFTSHDTNGQAGSRPTRSVLMDALKFLAQDEGRGATAYSQANAESVTQVKVMQTGSRVYHGSPPPPPPAQPTADLTSTWCNVFGLGPSAATVSCTSRTTPVAGGGFAGGFAQGFEQGMSTWKYTLHGAVVDGGGYRFFIECTHLRGLVGLMRHKCDAPTVGETYRVRFKGDKMWLRFAPEKEDKKPSWVQYDLVSAEALPAKSTSGSP